MTYPNTFRLDIIGDEAIITDLDLTRDYADVVKHLKVSELPQWIVEAISILNLCEYNKPLEGVGEHLLNGEGKDYYYLVKKFCDNEVV